MKNKLLLILLAVIIIAGGMYFLTKEKGDVPNDTGDIAIEDPGEEIETGESNDPKKPVSLDREDEVEIGKLPPDFNYKSKDGKEINLTNLLGEEISLDDYKGKIVLLNFWGTWCHWCDVEMPDLDELDKNNDDIVVLAVNVQEDKKTVEKYMNDGGYSFEVVLDLEGHIARKYFVASFPTTYFLDKEGIFLGGYNGMLKYEEMEGYLKAIRDNT